MALVSATVGGIVRIILKVSKPQKPRMISMPDTLRPKPAETGIDKYLVSRVQPREEPDSVAAIRFGNFFRG
jgi:hypothetical protein